MDAFAQFEMLRVFALSEHERIFPPILSEADVRTVKILGMWVKGLKVLK